MSSGPDQKLHPYGTALGFSDDNGATYTDFVELILASPPSRKRDSAQVTVLDSPGFEKESIPSWGDTDEMDGEVYFTAEQRETLVGLYEDADILFYRLTAPLLDGEITPFIIKFKGYFTELGMSQAKAEENNAFSCPFKLKKATHTGYSETQPT